LGAAVLIFYPLYNSMGYSMEALLKEKALYSDLLVRIAHLVKRKKSVQKAANLIIYPLYNSVG
jgi:hypothetical protein